MPLLSTILLLLTFATAEAANLRDACRDFAEGERETMKKCVTHGEFFELNGSFVEAVNAYSRDPDIRMRVLKSGADENALKICRATGWSVDNQISCMRSYPTEGVMKSCQKISGNEDDQLKCLRMGREASQVVGCTAFSNDLQSRFECLEKDVPVHEARACGLRTQNSGRVSCMREYVAKRDGTFYREEARRALASEPVKKKKK